jgi:two-component system nitrogen regulation sensor histidine kinase GlnL
LSPAAEGRVARKSKKGNSLAEQAGAITLRQPDVDRFGDAEPVMPDAKPRSSGRVARPAATRKSEPRVQAEAPTESFFRDLVWSLRNGVLAVTRDGTVTVMNDVAYQILGLKRRPSDIGQPFTEVLKGQQDVCRIVAGAFELSHLPNRAELRLKSSGKVIGYTLSQVRDIEGHVTGATLFFKDLTRVEQLEERERLRDRLAALGEMAAAIAHEVKNPLAGIEVMAGILKRQLADSPDAQSILGDIIKEAKMANAIVLEVLDFVRPIRLQVERISIADAIRDAVSMAESHVTRGNVQIRLDCPGNLPPIQGDSHQLRQIFTNLLTNAFEALNGTGQVTVVATTLVEDGPAGGEPQGPMVQVEVTDNGPGMPADVIDKIFSPFFTTKPQGSGLGLAIVRKIVDAHDGRIDVGVLEAGGTRFRVTLPVTGNHQLFG